MSLAITAHKHRVTLGEPLVEHGRRIHDQHTGLRVRHEQHAITPRHTTAMAHRGRQAQMPLPGHLEHAVRLGAHDQHAAAFPDVQLCARPPTQRAHNNALG